MAVIFGDSLRQYIESACAGGELLDPQDRAAAWGYRVFDLLTDRSTVILGVRGALQRH